MFLNFMSLNNRYSGLRKGYSQKTRRKKLEYSILSLIPRKLFDMLNCFAGFLTCIITLFYRAFAYSSGSVRELHPIALLHPLLIDKTIMTGTKQ